ncbi:unnamed protein product [Auanema sp. JU1783]|nr:unnamed protein product [Auanema sp. JU1783]
MSYNDDIDVLIANVSIVPNPSLTHTPITPMPLTTLEENKDQVDSQKSQKKKRPSPKKKENKNAAPEETVRYTKHSISTGTRNTSSRRLGIFHYSSHYVARATLLLSPHVTLPSPDLFLFRSNSWRMSSLLLSLLMSVTLLD